MATLHHTKLYVDEVKADEEPVKRPAQCVTSNTTVSFTDDDLLLGSQNRLFFVTDYIREQKIKSILANAGSSSS